MKVNNSTTSTPSFGTVYYDANATNAILNRLNSRDVSKFAKLTSKQNHNKNVDITFYVRKNSTRLFAYIMPKKSLFHDTFTSSEREGCFHLFRNPLTFIEKVCKKADDLSEKLARRI